MSLGDTVFEAIRVCDEMRAAGAPPVEIQRSLETLLRDVWPFTREWHYLCETCRDVGVEILACPVRPCDRRQSHGPHEYVRPCWCAAGERWKPKARTEATAVEAAARVQKSRGFTKAGR